MEHINYNLISLKCVLFVFFAGLGCLFPFLPLHMLETGLTLDEARIISIVSPFVAILGPLIVGPLADKLSGSNQKAKNGRHLRLMIAVVCILAAIFYLLLLTVPTVVRLKARGPPVTFSADNNGAAVYQKQCSVRDTCYSWNNDETRELQLGNCQYVCASNNYFALWNGTMTKITDSTEEYSTNDESTEPSDRNDEEYDNYPIEADLEDTPKSKREEKAQIMEPPHLCFADSSDRINCEVFIDTSQNETMTINLKSAEKVDLEDEEVWCKYPLSGYFIGRMSNYTFESIKRSNGVNCTPVIQCDVYDPYDSVLEDKQCLQIIAYPSGDPRTTFWAYLFLRSVADIFPTAALALLDAAIIIATRETSTGRGDVGRQLAWGTLGFAIFAPVVGLLEPVVNEDSSGPHYLIALVLFAVFMIIAALILIFANDMPLGPPEWWWHTKCGMLAVPMSEVKKYTLEIVAVSSMLLLLGVFWSALDSYLPWHLQELAGSPVLIGLTITIGALPAVPILWHAERIVDYCGHSNLLILAFVFYIVRYSGMAYITYPWWALLCESIEVFTLILMWVTAVLYMRHLVPRRFTVSGQALPVIAHFCIGRCIGAIIGGFVQSGSTLDSLRCVYRIMAVAAAIIATISFLLYHFVLKPQCTAPTVDNPRLLPTVMQNMNGNGSYTPLKIYHNGRARKGQFRY